MIGPACAALPFLAACAVARREPKHAPIRDALGAGLSYAICAHLDASLTDKSPRLLLILWACVAASSLIAYAGAWGLSYERTVELLGFAGVCLIGGLVAPKGLWGLATWGPFVVSTAVGAIALWKWWTGKTRNDRLVSEYLRDGFDEDGGPISVRDLKLSIESTIVQRIALILLVSDACMLLFIRWPQVQVWQGRSSAIVVAAIQAIWLIQRRRRENEHVI